jgi:hypothetical protein
MRRRSVIFAFTAVVVGAGALAIVLATGGGAGSVVQAAALGEPAVEVISPRNGARQSSRAVVVKVRPRNFRLAPRHFGGEPQLGEGNIRFALNRVPNCVEPAKLKRAVESAVGRGRLQGASFDYARYSGPNGVLAERIGSSGSYSPATRPEIYYRDLPAGFYRLVITLALNNGAPTPWHAVTNFQILPHGQGPPPCKGGKVPSAKAAAFG